MRRLPGDRDDAGVTLVELVVAMSVFLVVLSVVMGAVVSSTRTVVSATAVAESADQTQRAYRRFDREVRYADAVNRPTTVSGTKQYVELRTSAVAVGQPVRCTQWRYDSVDGTLAVRTWPDATTPAVGAWTTVAARLRTGSAALPAFTFLPAATNQRQGLRVVLQGSTTAGRSTSLDATFMARNTTTATATDLDNNNDGASDTQVCTQAGRP